MSTGQRVKFRTGVSDDAVSGRGTLLGFAVRSDPNTGRINPVAIVADENGNLEPIWVQWVQLLAE